MVFHWEYKLIELGDEAVDPLFEEWLLGPRYIKKQAPKHIRHDCIDSLILIGTRRAMDIISDIYTKGSENDRRFILEMLTGRGRYVTLDMDNKFIDTITDPSLISDGICEELVSALVSLIGFRFELPPDDAPDKINTFQKGIGAWRNEYLRRIRWSKTHNRYIINIPILDYIKTPN